MLTLQYWIQVFAILFILLGVWVLGAWARRKIAGLNREDREFFDEFIFVAKLVGSIVLGIIVFILLIFTAFGVWWR